MLWALAGALVVGLSLGLMGSGGSILTVPVLTYLVGQDEKIAIAGSLGIVGAISLVAGVPYARNRLVDYRSVLFFGVPGMVGAYLGASLSQFVSGTTQLAVFAALMLVAGVLMLKPLRDQEKDGHAPRSAYKVIIEGLLVGIVTGFVGVGGGFLIVPALVLLGGLPMHRAIGTSLFIIALKSFTGFYKYLEILGGLELELDWNVLTTFALIGILGSFVGKAVSTKLPQDVLKRSFAVFLFIVGTFIVLQSWQGLMAPTAS
ncbi:MAG: putative membrane protein YfcA [Chlamydiales bacterium]|jgi:uncharacterized membrane protein YfcA